MKSRLDRPIAAPGLAARLTAYYVRAVAMLLLAAGLARAALVLGITFDGASFATLDPAWRAGVVTLLLLDIFAAVGLWTGAAWGPVMWVVAIAVEVTMHTALSDIFGPDPLRVALHGVLFGIFAVLSYMDWRRSVAE